MRIGIVGSRDYPRLDQVVELVQALPEGTTVISGGAQGVDITAEVTAKAHGLDRIIFPALWDKYGKRAGAIRNQQIVESSDRIIAFWDGVSPGTKITIDMAVRAGKQVDIIKA